MGRLTAVQWLQMARGLRKHTFARGNGDRWVSGYLEPWRCSLGDLQRLHV